MKYVFSDCKDPRPRPIDTLTCRTEAVVEEVDDVDSALVLANPVTLDASLPLVSGGAPRSIIAHCQDKVWVDSVEGIECGQTVIQEDVASSDEDIMRKLHDMWAPRWNKLSHITDSQWDDINAFASRVLPQVDWAFPGWSASMVHKQISLKKPNAGLALMGLRSRTWQLCRLWDVKHCRRCLPRLKKALPGLFKLQLVLWQAWPNVMMRPPQSSIDP